MVRWEQTSARTLLLHARLLLVGAIFLRALRWPVRGLTPTCLAYEAGAEALPLWEEISRDLR
jgi:hypothetical protein